MIDKSLPDISERINLSYIAGLFDGEGCVSMNYYEDKSYFALDVSIGQKDKTILDFIKMRYPEGSIHIRPEPQVSMFYLRGKNAGRFLADMSNFCVIKKSQVDLALAYLCTLSGKKVSKNTEAFRHKLIDMVRNEKKVGGV